MKACPKLALYVGWALALLEQQALANVWRRLWGSGEVALAMIDVVPLQPQRPADAQASPRQREALLPSRTISRSPQFPGTV
jgi:hypothetical protein